MISEITLHHEEKGAQNNACIRLELSYSYRNHADRTDHMEPVTPLHSVKNMETAEPGWNMHCRAPHDTYIVVMTDGDEAILEKDRTGKDGKLKICKDKYMKVDCKNLLLEKKKYRRAIGDGE